MLDNVAFHFDSFVDIKFAQFFKQPITSENKILLSNHF